MKTKYFGKVFKDLSFIKKLLFYILKTKPVIQVFTNLLV